MRTALITGVTGQDGSYLAELLLSKQYIVHGIARRRAEGPYPSANGINYHYGDLSDGAALRDIVKAVQPDELYNLAAQSHVGVSFDSPTYTAQVNAVGTLHLLEAVRLTSPHTRFYQASTSEMFGGMSDEPLNESTPFNPRSPYACSKVFAHSQTVNHRTAFGLFACCGILFNHESERRSPEFVTRKITSAVARIKAGSSEPLQLGNLDTVRDWGFAGDYVEAMWLMLQKEAPDDFVIATGESHSVRAFVERAFSMAGLRWEQHVTFNPCLRRPAEVNRLLGDASKARQVLGWRPRFTFDSLVSRMVTHDCAAQGISLPPDIGEGGVKVVA